MSYHNTAMQLTAMAADFADVTNLGRLFELFLEEKRLNVTGARRLSGQQEIEKMMPVPGKRCYMQNITSKEFTALSIVSERSGNFPIIKMDYRKYRDHLPRSGIDF